jgi:hypothetical protein
MTAWAEVERTEPGFAATDGPDGDLFRADITEVVHAGQEGGVLLPGTSNV